MKIKTFEKYKFSKSVPLRYLLSAYHRLLLWHVVNKMIINQKGGGGGYQFQSGYMLNPGSSINKDFKEQVENNLARNFSSAKIASIIILLREENTRVISLLMFYENRKNMMFKVLGSLVYFIMDNYVCVDRLCFLQTKLHATSKGQGFENRT